MGQTRNTLHPLLAAAAAQATARELPPTTTRSVSARSGIFRWLSCAQFLSGITCCIADLASAVCPMEARIPPAAVIFKKSLRVYMVSIFIVVLQRRVRFQ